MWAYFFVTRAGKTLGRFRLQIQALQAVMGPCEASVNAAVPVGIRSLQILYSEFTQFTYFTFTQNLIFVAGVLLLSMPHAVCAWAAQPLSRPKAL